MTVDFWPWVKAYSRTQFAFARFFKIVYADDAAYCLDNVSRETL